MSDLLHMIISGGQTGADQAGLRAGRSAGIETGGWAAKGWMTEAGPAAWLADFGLTESQEAGYPARTRANVRDSDGTVWFGSGDSTGFGCTAGATRNLGRPFFRVVGGETTPIHVREWIASGGIRTLNVAGNRESKSPGIADRVRVFLLRVLSQDDAP